MTFNSITEGALRLPRSAKRLIALSLDAAICVFSVWFAFYLRLGYWPHARDVAHPVFASIAIALPIFVSFGLYRAIFRYAGWEALVTIARAVALYSLPFAGIYTLIGISGVPRTVGLIQPILLLLLIGSSRTFARVVFEESYTALWRTQEKPRVLIYGAGTAGRALAGAIAASRDMQLVGFIDDDPALWNSIMRGVPVISPADIEQQVARREISDILLAMPSASRTRRTEIVHQLKDLNLHVRTLPNVLEIASGKVSVSDLKDLEIEDLLGREPVPPRLDLLRKNIEGKVVMVTGAGGSIGSELCRQIVTANAVALLLVEQSEFNLYTIHQELSRIAAAQLTSPVLIPLLASVADERRMREILSTWTPRTVLHAAAYKHVPLVEHNALEGIRNNVFGTYTTAKLAQAYGVENFVLISTDKAVRPTNIMGTTKRLAEMVLQALQAQGSTTCYSMVRFGNVLGSSGSVVPLFRAQIAAGGPVTLTHTDITRYFMTIPEAAELVLQAGAMAVGGDVFVLDMGEPVRILDLARNMIELSGQSVRDDANPDGDIEIRITGLRPGEKLHEELLIGENPSPSGHPRVKRAQEHFLPWSRLEPLLETLSEAVENGDAATAREILREIVPEFKPVSGVVDFVHQRRQNGTVEAPSLHSAQTE